MKKILSSMLAISLFVGAASVAFATYYHIFGKAVTQHVSLSLDTTVISEETASGAIRLKNNQTKDTILARVDWALADGHIATIAAEGYYQGQRSSRRPNVDILLTIVDGQATNSPDKVSALVSNGSGWDLWAHYEEVIKGDISIQ